MKLSLTYIIENHAEEVKKGQMVAFYIPIDLAKFLKQQFDELQTHLNMFTKRCLMNFTNTELI